MTNIENVIESLEMCYTYSNIDGENTIVPQELVLKIVAMLKKQGEQLAMMRMIYGTDAKVVGEIVRCKDCKWYSEKGFCKHPNGGAGNIRPADWFCADGKRKEGR